MCKLLTVYFFTIAISTSPVKFAMIKFWVFEVFQLDRCFRIIFFLHKIGVHHIKLYMAILCNACDGFHKN